MIDTDTIKIKGYTLDSVLGRGGMSVVYLAHHAGLQRSVAIKVMSQRFLADQTFTDRFIHEARTVAKLRHPNIVTVYDVGSVNELPFMAMEYLSGGDLKSRIKEGIDPATAVKYLNSISETLSYAHSKGCIHRDIKPDNILFDENNELSVVDFGVAKTLASDTSITLAGSIIGTPKYMSPEQGQGRAVTEKSDFYSLGVVFYEMLMGIPPYEADSSVSLMMRHIHDPIPKLPKKLSNFQALINGLMEKQPDKRLADVIKIEKMADKSLERYIRKYVSHPDLAPVTQNLVVLSDGEETAIWDGPSVPKGIMGRRGKQSLDLKGKTVLGVFSGALILGGMVYFYANLGDVLTISSDLFVSYDPIVGNDLEPGNESTEQTIIATLPATARSQKMVAENLALTQEAQNQVNSANFQESLNAEKLEAVRQKETQAQVSSLLAQVAFVYEASLATAQDMAKAIDLIKKAEAISPTSEAVLNALGELKRLIIRRNNQATETQNIDEAEEFLTLAKRLGVSEFELDRLALNIRQAMEEQRSAVLEQALASVDTSAEWQQYLADLTIFQKEVSNHSLPLKLLKNATESLQQQVGELTKQNRFDEAEEWLQSAKDSPFFVEEVKSLQASLGQTKEAYARNLAVQKKSTQLKQDIDELLSQKQFFDPKGGAYQSILEYRKVQAGDKRYFNSAISKLTSQAQTEAVQLFTRNHPKESEIIIGQLERYFPQKAQETRQKIAMVRTNNLRQEIHRLLFDTSPSLDETSALLSRFESYLALVGKAEAQSTSAEILDKIAKDVEYLIYTRDIDLGRSILNKGIVFDPDYLAFRSLNIKMVELELAASKSQNSTEDIQQSQEHKEDKEHADRGRSKKLPTLPSF